MEADTFVPCMALLANTPTEAFTHMFPSIAVSGGGSGKQLLFSMKVNELTVLDREGYTFNTGGMVTIRHLGDTLAQYFYDENYDIRRFSLPVSLVFEATGLPTLTSAMVVFFCRSYIGHLTAEAVRYRPLSKCKEKHTVAQSREYISFVSVSGAAVMAAVRYQSNGNVQVRTVTLHTFTTTDDFQTIDVSAAVMADRLAVTVSQLIYWDTYVSGHLEKTVRYTLDKEVFFPTTTLLFQNSFGAVESFLCRGVTKDGFSAERETVVRDGRLSAIVKSSLLSFTTNTGPLTDMLRESFKDLLSSRSLMLLKDGVAIPVIINSENISMANYPNKLPAAEFSYSYSERHLTLYGYDTAKKIFDRTFDTTYN
jgi:hypothetical protein